MALPTDIDDPSTGEIVISLAASGVQFSNFLSVELNEHYLTPCSAFNFDLDDDELSPAQKTLLVPGAGVKVTIRDLTQCCGYIDDIYPRAGRSGGAVWHIECREWNSPILDAHIDPKVQFSTSMTLEQLLQTALSPFSPFGGGSNTDIKLVTDAGANRNIITGATRGTKTNKNGTVIKSVLAHQVKPYQHEGVWSFMSRMSQRFGLWLRPSADGTTIIASTPDFTQDPSYTFMRSTANGAQNNIQDGGIKFSRKNQPAVIYASGFGGGGVFANSTLRAVILNPCISADVAAIAANYPGVPVVTPPILGTVGAGFSATGSFVDPNARPLFLYDPESHTQAELNSFLLRELSLRMRESLVGGYDFDGLMVGGSPLAIDTIAQVQDDKANNWNGPLWIMDRTFSKKHGSGSVSHLGLIRPGTLSFGATS